MAVNNRRVDGFNAMAAGRKLYGSGRSFPTMGPVDPLGYAERDRKHNKFRNAALRRLKASQAGNYGSADYLRRVR